MQMLIELPYWPPVSWLTLAWHSEMLWLEATENFQKGSFRNRCHIAGPNGLQRLSIPLEKGKHQQTPIRDVRISRQESWQALHWKSICTAYGNAPYYEHLADDLAPFYHKRFDFLFDFNLELLQFFAKTIGWAIKFKETLQYQKLDVAKSAGITDFRNVLSPKDNTRPKWFQGSPYPQVFLERHGFLPDLSALDLLFCCGTQSGAVLQHSLFKNAGETNPLF